MTDAACNAVIIAGTITAVFLIAFGLAVEFLRRRERGGR